MKIIIVTTGNEVTRETGFGGMKACLAVKNALKKRFIDVNINVCNDEKDLDAVANTFPDFVILGSKYVQGVSDKKIWLSEYFKKANINYTGSKREILEFDSNKIKAKELLIKKGVATSEFHVVLEDDFLLEKDIKIPYPIFLKPIDAANGNGVDDESLVYDYKSFKNKSDKLFSKYGKVVLAEKYLAGREFTVAIIENELKQTVTVAPIEIVPPKNKDNIRILGEKVKTENSEKIKKVTDELLKFKLEKLALQCFYALGVRDFGRIDIKMDEAGVCNFIEANLVPGMTEGSSYFPKAFEIDAGISYSDVINLIIENAIDRIVVDGEKVN